ncbi:MAG: DUF3788 domain-containing protein [Oscillospiraceae bacterium]|nr:DUF3788 domain-containing protein [Oscillospiraceae bacterium]
MNNQEKLRLRDPEAAPTDELLEQILGDSYAAYEVFQDALPGLEIEQEWQWYTPHKAWFAKGQHFWMTPRGAKKEKNLYWLHVFEGFFNVAVWFKEKNRAEILSADVSEKTKRLIRDTETYGKMPTFPVVFEITAAESLADIYILIDYKKRLERYEVIKARQAEVGAERQARIAKQENMRLFLETVRQREGLLTGFDEALWRSTVEVVTVYAVDDIRVMFRDGRELRVGE